MLDRTHLGIFSLALVLAAASGCDDEARVIGRQITARSDLIGGPGALAEVGDYLLANEQIRLIIQGPGYSRGFGLYGGSLIDADLQRPRTAGDSSGGRGFDNFSELFPGIFLKAMKPGEKGITVKEADDGSGAVSIIVTGSPADFLFVTTQVNGLLVESDDLIFRNEFKLLPGKRYVEITTTVVNQGSESVEFPGSGISGISEQLRGFRLPVGDVILFGAGNDVFSEQAGFDLRYTLERLYASPPSLPRLPGLITPFLATRGDEVSYGFMSGVTEPERSFITQAGYEGVPPDSLVIPFVASSFTGAFYGAAPELLGPRSSFSYKKYFIVGRGDVASIRDVVNEIRGTPTGTFSGLVRDARTLAPEAKASVVTYDERGSPYGQHTTDDRGNFLGTYAPGRYSYRVVTEGRFTTEPVEFDVAEGGATHVEVMLPALAYVSARIRGEDGRPLPSRCSLVAQYPFAAAGFDPKDFLYDLQVGEKMRPTDLVPDTSDPSTREYVEHIVHAPLGQKIDPVRPGHYRAVCSRGMEYDTASREIDVVEGKVTEIEAVLRHVVDTDGWVSGDYHLHADPSVDSSLPLEDRVGQAAAEGLDVASSSDHNFITDYAPVIAGLGLEDWLQGMVGLELTTLEIGHFNAFPLTYDPGPITKGSFEWSGRKPVDLFNDLRALGKYGPEETIVQVNHPRDSILGYLNAYHFNPDTGEPEDKGGLLEPMGPEFGADRFDFGFDAMEIYNGKRFDLLHSYRVPEVLPPPPLPETIPPAGAVLRDEDGKVAFPGSLEDWYAMLGRGFIYTATANSDSHSADDEPGIPRTYTPVTNDRPGQIIEREIVSALKGQRAMLTNGPFVRVSMKGSASCRDQRGEDLGRTDCGMGEVVPATGGSVLVTVTTEMAPWISIDTVTFVRGGETVMSRRGDKATLTLVEQAIPVNGDSFVVVEVSGSESMWPVIRPLEVPSLQVSDALGSIAGALGINLTPFGNLQPPKTFVTRPYAFTNPIFIDADGDGRYRPPGEARQSLRAASEPRAKGKRTDPRSIPLIVKLFGAFAGHGH